MPAARYLPAGARSLLHRRDGGGVHTVGGQRDRGEGRGVSLALLSLVGHEGRQGVELLLTLPTEEHVFIICNEGDRITAPGFLLHSPAPHITPTGAGEQTPFAS